MENLRKLLTSLVWVIVRAVMAVLCWVRDVFFCVILFRLFKNLKYAFVVILVIPMLVMGTMENVKNDAGRKLESRIEYALKNDWKGDKINVQIPAGISYGMFSKEEAMAIALKAEANFNERAKARHDNRRLGFYVKPNVVYDQFIKVKWESGNIRITNK